MGFKQVVVISASSIHWPFNCDNFPFKCGQFFRFILYACASEVIFGASKLQLRISMRNIQIILFNC